MNRTSMYPGLKDNRVYLVDDNGFIEVWSVELDEPVGSVPTRAAFKPDCIAIGWTPCLLGTGGANRGKLIAA